MKKKNIFLPLFLMVTLSVYGLGTENYQESTHQESKRSKNSGLKRLEKATVLASFGIFILNLRKNTKIGWYCLFGSQAVNVAANILLSIRGEQKIIATGLRILPVLWEVLVFREALSFQDSGKKKDGEFYAALAVLGAGFGESLKFGYDMVDTCRYGF